MTRNPRRILFSSDEQRRTINRAFAVLFVLVVGSSIGGLYALVSYFEKTSVLEATDRIEKSSNDIHTRFRRAINAEARRPFAEYSYFNLRSAQLESFLKFSTISSLVPNSQVPGLVGYFQVRDGNLELPFFPRGRHLDLDRRDERTKLARRILGSLVKTLPVSATEDDTRAFKAAFGGIKLPDLTVLPSDFKAPVKTIPLKKLGVKGISKSKAFTKEAIVEPENIEDEVKSVSESAENFPMQALLLESGSIVFYRSVLQNGTRYVQGFVADQKTFFTDLFRSILNDKSLGEDGRLSVAIDENILDLLPAPAENSQIIYRAALPAPLERVELIYSVGGAKLSRVQKSAIAMVSVVVLLFCAGLYLVYRASLRQNQLLRDQANFVSAVSHELRTPLTAIRMHSELLTKGWVDAESEKKKSYDFILAEAERLSRLIENVLQFARLERGKNLLKVESHSARTVAGAIRQTIESIVKAAGYELETDLALSETTSIRTDLDSLSQIMINLTDNAVKFSSDSQVKKVVFSAREARGSVQFAIRDFGPGISGDAAPRIFELFVRAEDERVRRTSGTGMGLALVKSLAEQMGAEVTFENKAPGCEFTVSFWMTKS